ncbi:MAG: hemerythrin domain-containing protein [Burkholderiaceae bacterium]
MAASRSTSRAASAARTQILNDLKDDHKRVKKAYKDFQKLDIDADPETCQAIVEQVCQELTVHATLEEELLYPAARGAADEDLIDEAEVEHETVKALIAQLEGMGPEDEKYAARFIVLCEYVLHHVKEEEGEMFPQLERSRLDWESMAAEMAERREELMPSADDAQDADDTSAAMGQSDDATVPSPRGKARSAGTNRSSGGRRAE